MYIQPHMQDGNNFNPRPRKEGDPVLMLLMMIMRISIHALVKRATKILSYWFTFLSYFNPRPRKEGDICLFCTNKLTLSFQSTPSWRGRPQSTSTMMSAKIFQSTPSWRGRQIYGLQTGRMIPFQSTPSWRGRPGEICRFFATKEFQSTPSWRGRPFFYFFTKRRSAISIHALVKRATYICYKVISCK